MDDQQDQGDATGPAQHVPKVAQGANTQPVPPGTPPPLPYSGGQPFTPGAHPSTFAGANDPTYPGMQTEPDSLTPAGAPPQPVVGFPPPPAYLPPPQYTLPPAYIPPPAGVNPPIVPGAPAPAAPARYNPPATPAQAAPAVRPQAPVVVATATAQPRRKSTTPLVVEAILAFFGIYGVGWIMARKRGTGVILLILSVFWLASAATGTVLTVGAGVFLFGPANLVFLILSVYLLLIAMRRS